MRFLPTAYLSYGRLNEIVTVEEFSKILERINIPENQLVKTIYVPGSTGQKNLYDDLLRLSNLDNTESES